MADLTPLQGEIHTDPILAYFEYEHLPEHLQEVSKLFYGLAFKLS